MTILRKSNQSTRKSANRKTSLPVVLIVVLVLMAVAFASAQESKRSIGKISGTVVDSENGEPVVGATLMLVGTKMGTRADLDGKYWIKSIPIGSYSLKVSCIGYQATEITNVIVVENEVITFDLTLHSEVIQTEGIKVRAKAVQNTEAVLLKYRKEALVVSDAISSEDISRSGSGDAAEAMSRVTGASVVDGKHVYIRGLGDRYSTTHLNGSLLPSPDPDRQDVPMDLVPATLLDNIVIEKTFTPDKPGNFAGGSVNLTTKDYPEQRTLKFSISSGYNSNTTGKDGLLSQNSSSTDWLGFDDGSRDIPRIILENPEMQDATSGINRFINADSLAIDSVVAVAQFASASAAAFAPEMEPHSRKAPVNQGYSLSFGDMYLLGERPLGVVASLTYSRKYSTIDGGLSGVYDGKAAASQEAQYHYQRGTDEVLWGGLATLTFSPHERHKLSSSFMYNRNGESRNEYYVGRHPYHYNETELDSLRLRWLKYTERELRVLQFSGEHVGLPLPGAISKDIRTDWTVSFARTDQDEPDVRYFGDVKAYIEDWADDGEDPWNYSITQTGTELPSRYWRTLDESNNGFNFNLSIPLDRDTRFKTGFSYLDKDRSYRDRRFEYVFTSDYDGDIEEFITSVGIDTIRTINENLYQILFENYVREETGDLYQYDGHQKVSAFYGMVESTVPKIDKLTFVGGLRYETTDMFGAVHDTTKMAGSIDESDLLPSVNLIYRASENVNLRASYGRTLARPTVREITPVPTEEFGGKATFIGNENLKHTVIDNLDLRWEWFIRPGEVLAISGFYKVFENPIEVAFIGRNGNVFVQNVDRGTVLGLELEYRRRLDWLAGWLSNFTVGSNLTLVDSKVDIAESERKDYPDFDHDRPMSNQSPYVVNLDIAYENDKHGTTASLFFNKFGRRFAVNSQLPTPDVYEESRSQLDFLVSQKMFGGTVLKLSAKNILNDDVLFKYDCERVDGSEAIYKKYSKGVSFGLGVGYSIW